MLFAKLLSLSLSHMACNSSSFFAPSVNSSVGRRAAKPQTSMPETTCSSTLINLVNPRLRRYTKPRFLAALVLFGTTIGALLIFGALVTSCTAVTDSRVEVYAGQWPAWHANAIRRFYANERPMARSVTAASVEVKVHVCVHDDAPYELITEPHHGKNHLSWSADNPYGLVFAIPCDLELERTASNPASNPAIQDNVIRMYGGSTWAPSKSNGGWCTAGRKDEIHEMMLAVYDNNPDARFVCADPAGGYALTARPAPNLRL